MLQVELTICAHHCFTMACHLEGISDLLRLCRKLADVLDEANQSALLVRYTLCSTTLNEKLKMHEMNYCVYFLGTTENFYEFGGVLSTKTTKAIKKMS